MGLNQGRRRPVHPLLLALASSALAVLGAELLLRALGRPRPVQVGWRTFFHVYEVGREANQLRFRGRPIEYADGDYVVVLVGDSQVEARACAFEWMPEQRLEAYLREATAKPVKVFSLAVSGYGQDQQLLALREYFAAYRADRVVLWLTLTNDVKDNTWPTFTPIDGRPKPTFWLENGELAGPNRAPGPQPGASSRIAEYLRRWLAGSPDAAWQRERLPPPYQPMRRYDREPRREWQEMSDKGLLDAEALRREKSDRALLFSPRSERARYGVELTHALLDAIRDEAAAHGAAFTLFATDEPDRHAEVDGVYVVDGEYWRVSSQEFWSSVEEIGEGFDFHLIPVEEPQWRVGPMNHHLNEHATDAVMRELARRLAPEL